VPKKKGKTGKALLFFVRGYFLLIVTLTGFLTLSEFIPKV